MQVQYSIPLNAEFRFVHEPLDGSSDVHQRRFVGRDDELGELAARLVLSDGGAFLITGYRGVGKSTFVNRVLKQVDQRLAAALDLVGPVELVDVHLNVPTQMASVDLMFHILRGLYARLRDKNILQALDPDLRAELELAFMRTSRSLAIKNAAGLESSAGVTISAGLPVDGGAGKMAFSSKRTRSESREMKYLAYDDKAAEYDLIHIARCLTGGYQPRRSRWHGLIDRLSHRQLPRKKLKVVFVFDELDKIEEPKEGGQSGIDVILANLKTLFTTSGICFVFVAGRGTHDRWIEDLGLGDSIYESVFSYARYLPPMWAHADRICDPFLDDNAFGSVKATELAATYASFKKFLVFNGRGIPRRILRKFNERVRWDEARPALSFSAGDVRQFRFFADLQDVLDSHQRELLGELEDDGFSGRADRQRLALYYLVDWVLLRGFEEFSLGDAVAASRRLSRLIAPGEEAAPQLAGALLRLLVEYQYLETVATRVGGGDAASSASPARTQRYRLTRKRLIEMGSLAGVLEPERETVTTAERVKKFGNRYDVRSVVARGGMSTVYLAEDRRFNRVVVIKEQLPDIADDAIVRQRFRHETEVLSKLAHENIVRMYDADLEATPPYIVLEHVDGVPLTDLIAAGRLTRTGIALKIARDLVRALAHIHKRGVLWLDSKPSNVLVTAQGRVVLLDFGIARSKDDSGRGTGIVLGTLAYSSPEQLRDDPLDERSDIYSIGVTLYQMFTGRLPFGGEPTSIEMAVERFTQAPAAPSSVATIPKTVDDAILKCLEVERDKRFPSAEALLDALPEGPSHGEFIKEFASALEAPVDASADRIAPRRRKDPPVRDHETAEMLLPPLFVEAPRPSPRVPRRAPAPATVRTSPAVAPPPIAAGAGVALPPLGSVGAPPSTAVVVPSPATGPQLAMRTGQVWPLRGEQSIKIGRTAQNEIQIADMKASRYHAAVQPGPEGWTLVDQNSRVGTYVNQIRITAPRLLRDGDVITIGETELTYTGAGFADSEDAAVPPGIPLVALLERLRRTTSEEVLDYLLDAAITIAQAERGLVMLADEGGSLQVKAARAAGRVPLPGKAFSTSHKIPQEVFETGRERLVTDLFDGDERFIHEQTIMFAIRNVFCLPLKARSAERPFGVIYLDSRERGALLSSSVRMALQTLADEGAVAIETMYLIGSVQA